MPDTNTKICTLATHIIDKGAKWNAEQHVAFSSPPLLTAMKGNWLLTLPFHSAHLSKKILTLDKQMGNHGYL